MHSHTQIYSTPQEQNILPSIFLCIVVLLGTDGLFLVLTWVPYNAMLCAFQWEEILWTLCEHSANLMKKALSPSHTKQQYLMSDWLPTMHFYCSSDIPDNHAVTTFCIIPRFRYWTSSLSKGVFTLWAANRCAVDLNYPSCHCPACCLSIWYLLVPKGRKTYPSTCIMVARRLRSSVITSLLNITPLLGHWGLYFWVLFK